jgi:hypothetical protein
MASWREGGKLRNVLPGLFPKDEQRGGPGEGQGSKERGFRALFPYPLLRMVISSITLFYLSIKMS